VKNMRWPKLYFGVCAALSILLYENCSGGGGTMVVTTTDQASSSSTVKAIDSSLSRISMLQPDQMTVVAGQAVTLAMHFDAVPTSEDYQVFVHFVDAAGNQASFSGDHSPPVPSSRWSGSIDYNKTIAIPTSAAPGSYSIRVGLYQNIPPYSRVTLAVGNGVSVDNEIRYRVGNLNVMSAMTPPSNAPPPNAPPTTVPPAASTMIPSGVDPNLYALTFNDDFNSFNTGVWNEAVWYETSDATKNFTTENGLLKIWPQRNAAGQFKNRTIDTDGKYYQTYGFFEIEARLPVGKGCWPAFWLFNHIGDRRPEIDIMEAYSGGGPNSGWSDANFHPTAFGATIWITINQNGGGKVLQTPDLSAAFHKYGLKWEPNRLTFYFDGVAFYSANVSFNDPMYIMLDLWFGSASGTPDNSTPQGKGNSYEVNYVRAWKLK
jgi:beta-glucanase (GH16 family)